ncbi:unnamed protein product [Allacma fusca]|uniref:Uncharacterized protein n=1 Tax=Allacma fusca TaxID=39272 RepID=A0A8J2LB24_9HEXA|nr:unnamed protein product [Allacma fusca]
MDENSTGYDAFGPKYTDQGDSVQSSLKSCALAADAVATEIANKADDLAQSCGNFTGVPRGQVLRQARHEMLKERDTDTLPTVLSNLQSAPPKMLQLEHEIVPQNYLETWQKKGKSLPKVKLVASIFDSLPFIPWAPVITRNSEVFLSQPYVVPALNLSCID